MPECGGLPTTKPPLPNEEQFPAAPVQFRPPLLGPSPDAQYTRRAAPSKPERQERPRLRRFQTFEYGPPANERLCPSPPRSSNLHLPNRNPKILTSPPSPRFPTGWEGTTYVRSVCNPGLQSPPPTTWFGQGAHFFLDCCSAIQSGSLEPTTIDQDFWWWFEWLHQHLLLIIIIIIAGRGGTIIIMQMTRARPRGWLTTDQSAPDTPINHTMQYGQGSLRLGAARGWRTSLRGERRRHGRRRMSAHPACDRGVKVRGFGRDVRMLDISG